MNPSCERLLRPAVIGAVLALAACAAPAPTPTQPSRTAAVAPLPPLPPADLERRFAAALQLQKSGHGDAARAALAQLARDYPGYSGPLTALGILDAGGPAREQALASFAAAARANPANGVALNWLGSLYRELGDYARAEQAYRQALEARPDHALAHLNLGILYDVYLRRPGDALVEYRRYRETSPAPRLVVDAWIRALEATQASPRVAAAGQP